MSESLIINEIINETVENIPTQYSQTVYPFRPVRCKQTDLEKIKPTKGFIYFTLDTQKIYYGTDTEFLPMGGSSGIYYASKTFEDESDTSFAITDFAAGVLPNNINDLIINVGNNETRNGFYRVIEIFPEQETVLTSYLPVGGGGGSGSGTSSGKVAIGYVSPQTDSVLAGKDYYITFTINAEDSNGDQVPNGGTATWFVNGKKYDGGTVYNGTNTFNIGPYLSSLVDSNTIKLTVSIDTGGTVHSTASKQWSIVAVDLGLEWDWGYGPEAYINDDNFTLFWTPRGNIDAQAYIWFDNNSSAATVIDIPAKMMGQQQSPTFESLDYGVHSVSMQLMAIINGENHPTDIITHQLTFIKDGVAPLLTVPFNQISATQYDTVNIPFLVYDPNETEVEVEFLINDNVVSTDTYDRSYHEDDISYTFGISGTVKLGLRVKGSLTAWETTMAVTPLSLDVNEVSNYAFKIKASDFVGNDGLRALQDSSIVTFSDNFDWVNGGLKTEVDENGYLRKYICIKNHTTMTINYNLFKHNAVQYGKNFKIIFKTANCYDYDAQVLSCYTNECGLRLNAQDATFTSASTADLITHYYENSYIELELDIWKKDTNYTTKPDNFVMYWIDGVPANVKEYSSTVSQIQQIAPQPITIGSNDCDVHIYLIKAYEKYLTEEEHLSNFIVDAPNVEEMLKRFNRNDILDNSGNISYSKLITQNPGCNAFLYRIDRMTKNKEDKVGGCDFEQYYSDPLIPDNTASNVEIRVQGTSSAAYGVAAYNIDSKFKDGVVDKDGNHHAGWAMRDSSIPINYSCTKVNVASCENANNALNQEWYNRFQPYWDAHRRKSREDGKIARDCMDFIPGVMFIRDDNNTIISENNNEKNLFWDNNKYMSLSPENRPYLQYAICNMGNSKKNIEVFHSSLTDLPNTCCVEVLDNQNDEHKMKVVVDESAFDSWVDENGKEQDPFYEFRFPDEDNFDYSQMKTNFINLVNWMATNNPAAATNEPLDTPETYEEYTFKGFIPPGYDTLSPSGVTLAGTKISTYAGTYNTDSYKRRMAKMLKECEDHLVMDSIVYHYLFIERHTMVDNVAKNTFWSTEDGLHWDLTKNYDNDTADGNDNSGNLDFYYGLEVGDTTDAGEQVFNAPGAVWLEFIKGLDVAREELYKQLYSKGAWNTSSYLTLFKNFQSVIPERCWIYDYFRKYIRPRRLGLDENTYLNRLEGGKKTHQREQFETYQDIYQNSKYKTGYSNTFIDLRLAAGELKDTDEVTISYYIDCYSYAKIGGREYHNRYKRGDIEKVPVGQMIVSADDATCYFYYENMVQTLGNLANLYPTYLNGGNAIRLRSIEIGSDADGYKNERLETLGFSSNTMLETIHAQNIGKESSLNELDLTNLSALNEIRINGSGFKGVSFADAGLLKTAYINDITTLKMSNLNKIETIEFEHDRQNLNRYKLTTISVANCPDVDTYDLVLNSDISIYYLTNVNWTINNINEVSIDNNTDFLTGINILDHLLRTDSDGQSLCIPEAGYSTQTALTGSLTINIANINIDEYLIYEKYHKIFPNLEIIYGENVSSDNLIKALRIKFYENDKEDSDILYSVLASSNNTLTLAELTSNDGPSGVDLSAPIKDQDYYYTYHWNENLETDDLDWHINELDNDYTHVEMLTLIPDKDLTLIPIFTSKPRKYSVTLRDYDGTDLEHDYISGVSYNDTITLPLYLYRNHNSINMRWVFKGWISPTDYLSGNKNPTLLTSPVTITTDFYAYAYYVEENCETVASPLEYFTFNQVNFTITENNTTYRGYEINLNPIYKDILQGKITLPSTYNGSSIVSIGNFTNMTNVTDVYFLKDAQYVRVNSEAFAIEDLNASSNLTNVFLPNSIISIGNRAFANQRTLKTVFLNNNILCIGAYAFAVVNFLSDQLPSGDKHLNIEINELPSNLMTLGQSAFYYGGSNIKITKLPKAVKRLEQFTFTRCENVAISEFGSNSNEIDGSQLYYISYGALQDCGKGLTELYVKNSVTTFEIYEALNARPFSLYAVGSLKEAYFARSEEEYNIKGGAATLGIDSSVRVAFAYSE